jgi:DNA-binding NarL/FixJ family response regulator
MPQSVDHAAPTGPVGVRQDSITSLLIVSDIRLYREGLADTLAQTGKFDVRGALSDIGECLRQTTTPHVILLDMSVPDALSGVRLLKRDPPVPIVALGLRDSEQEVLNAVEAGVSGFVLRDATLEELICCLETVTRGELTCSPRMAGALLRRVTALATGRPSTGKVKDITPRERDIMALVDQGLSNKEIATRLSIEVTTVKHHIHNVLERLGVRRRADAAAMLRQFPARLPVSLLRV